MKYNELMSEEELSFLIKKDERETSLFYKVLTVMMTICFILPFIVAWFRAANGEERPFEYGYYFLGVGFLLSFVGMSVYATYRHVLGKLKADIKKKTKTVERAKIIRKQKVRQNSTYYFYLDSPVKLSIEVAEIDYYRLGEGDEINIEYSEKAKFYFGYF